MVVISRAFDGTDDSLLTDSPPVTAYALTMAAWFYTADLATDQEIVCLVDKDVTNHYHSLIFAGSLAGNTMRYNCAAGASAAVAESTTGVAADAWQHVCAVGTSATSRAVFLNGGSKGTNATSRTPANLDRLSVGRRMLTTPVFPANGRIAELAIWNVALSDAEVAALARGAHPLRVRTGNIVFRPPLWGLASPELDYTAGRRHLTVNGATIGTLRPPVQAPPGIGGFWVPSTPAGGATVTGAASITGAGAVGATGVRTALGSAAVAGAGVLSAAGVRSALGLATVAGAGAVAATGVRSTLAAGSVAGAGAVAATGLRSALGVANVAGVGAVAATGVRSTFAAGAISGTGSIAASGHRLLTGAATVAGAGSVAAAGTRAAVAVAEVEGTGGVNATGGVTRYGAASLAGSGVVSAAGLRTVAVGGAISGTGTIAASGLRAAVASAAITGVGAISAAGSRTVYAVAAVGGTGTITAMAAPDPWTYLLDDETDFTYTPAGGFSYAQEDDFTYGLR